MSLACLAAPAPSDQWKREGKRELSGIYNMALLRPTEKSPHLTTPLVTVASLLKPRGYTLLGKPLTGMAQLLRSAPGVHCPRRLSLCGLNINQLPSQNNPSSPSPPQDWLWPCLG